ncbi:trigger factor [Bacteroidota bacterium]
MESKVNVISDYEHELEVDLAYDEITPEINEAYSEERKKIEMPGFRKGKVPMDMLKKMFGEAIEYKASEKIATKKFWDVVDEKKLKPISTPQLVDINFERGDKLFFKVKYEVMPSLKLKNYKGLEIEKPVFKVKDEEVQKEVDYMLKSSATFEDAEVIENEKYKITVDLQKLDDDGNPVENMVSENMAIDLTDERVNVKIRENAIGKKLDDSFSFEFTDEHSHGEGEETHKVTYKYTAFIKKVEKIVYPELTEEFIKSITKDKAATEEELKNEIRTNIQRYYDNQSESIYSNALLNKIITNNDVKAPAGYTELLLDRFVEAEKEEAKRKGQPGINEKSVRESLKSKAEWNAKWQIVLENLTEAEAIKVEDKDLEILAKEESEKTGISMEKMMDFYKSSNRSASLLEEKVIKFLIENNKTKEIDPEQKNAKSKEQKNEK